MFNGIRRFWSEDEIDELREASEAIGMAAEGVDLMIDHTLDNLRRIEPQSLRAKPYYCGGTTLTGQAQ